MTELLSALLGALVEGAATFAASAWQTGKILRHERSMIASERDQAAKDEAARTVRAAAEPLVTALAQFTNVDPRSSNAAAQFVVMTVTAQVHAERVRRTRDLLRAGATYAHALPQPVLDRWNHLVWFVRYVNVKHADRDERTLHRDYLDLLHYAEYVRRSLIAAATDGDLPAWYAAPEPRREGHRPWGLNPASTDTEPDLTAWSMSDRLVGSVTFTDGQQRWYGPGGEVEELDRPPGEPENPRS